MKSAMFNLSLTGQCQRLHLNPSRCALHALYELGFDCCYFMRRVENSTVEPGLKDSDNFSTKNTLKTLYTGTVEPYFANCCSVWGNCGITEKNHIEKLQNRAKRIRTNSRLGVNAGLVLTTLGLNTLQDVTDNKIHNIVYKVLKELFLKNCGFYQYRTTTAQNNISI